MRQAILLFILTLSTQAQNCADLLQLKIENTTLTEASDQPAGRPVTVRNAPGPLPLPAHCLVHGETNHHTGTDGKAYGDKFEIRLPKAWKDRLLFQGGGGLNGVLHPAVGVTGAAITPETKSALHFGYAVVSTDSGHQDPGGPLPDGSFGADPSARDDYNFLSTKRVTDVARQVIKHHYGRPVKYAYFKGCSNGGREALQMAQRYPEYFNGIIAGAPAFNLTNAAIAEAWNTMQLAAVSPKLTEALTESDLQLLAAKVLEQCDTLDGLKDGLIFRPEACRFNPETLPLSPAKITALKNIYTGPKNSQGKALYSPWPYDSGVADPGWRIWMTGLGNGQAINVRIFPSFFNGLALAGEKPEIDIFHFNFDTDPPRIARAAKDINATSTNYTKFRQHGGKLILYTGISDPVFSPLDLIRYYKQIPHDFSRLFLSPGMCHCQGGPGLDDFDSLIALQRWVENGEAPERLIAAGRAFPGRTRPLCAYPKTAKYTGKGDPESASSFTCALP